MQIRGRRLKFTAVSVLVVLALTGFSTGRGRGGSHSSSGSHGSGGGCSSSSQDHDSSRSSSTSGGGSYSSGGSGGSYGSDDDDDDYGTSGGGSYNRRPNYGSRPTSTTGSGSGKALRDGTAKLVTCATPASPHATVEVSNPNSRKATFSVSVTFEDARSITVTDRNADITVPAQGKATVEVEVGGGSGLVDSVDHCKVDGQALVDD
ncbi:hypothetical protein QF034_003464 [Streptomyces africanus]|uniref:Secreted protein n=1 Tax=Streptomyces africanus TaxID=231024 RepID=A0ABU0QPC7_9ACTN|nr:hypothetical protein [Streptomyces africanus]MDQ0749233.1 hypothetical protein [Streptomyces africanus]